VGAAALLAERLEEVLDEEQPEPEERARPTTRCSRRAEAAANPLPCCPTQGAPSR
jgi:hypothetical protein